jgi:hypothetical protein
MTSGANGSEPRRTDVLSLIFGLLFLGVAGAWAASYYLDLDWNLDWRLPHLGWLVAGGLVLLGLLGILGSLRRERAEIDRTEVAPAAPAAAEPATAPVTPPAAGPIGEGDRPE